MDMVQKESLDDYITRLGGKFIKSHRYFRRAVHLRDLGGHRVLMGEICQTIAKEEKKSRGAVEKGIARAAKNIWDCPDSFHLLVVLGRSNMDTPRPEELIDYIIQAWKKQQRGGRAIQEKEGKQSSFVISRFYGITIKMFPQTDLGIFSPHLHVTYRNQVGVISLQNLEMVEGDLSPQVLRMTLDWTEARRKELLDMWSGGKRRQLPPLE